MAKVPKTATIPASKREVNRMAKESANLWEALTDVEIAQNVIVSKLLEGVEAGDFSLFGEGVNLTIEQADKLKEIRERLTEFDKSPLFTELS